MKHIVISHGFHKSYPVQPLINSGAKTIYFSDSGLPFDIKKLDNGNPALHFSGRPVIKNGIAAIPSLAQHQNKETGKKQPIYLTRPEHSFSIDEIDLFIPYFRPGSLTKQLQFMDFLKFYGVPTLETSHAANVTMQKIKTHEVLSKANIPVPDSVALLKEDKETANRNALSFYIQKNGKVLLKSSVSTIGRGIYIPKSPSKLIEQLNKLFTENNNVLLQEKINIGPELHHIRVAMSFGEIIATQKFIAKESKKTSHVGGSKSVENIGLTPEQINICYQVQKIVGFNLGSLDCLISTSGDFYVLEINIMPRIIKQFPEQPERMIDDIIKRYL